MPSATLRAARRGGGRSVPERPGISSRRANEGEALAEEPKGPCSRGSSIAISSSTLCTSPPQVRVRMAQVITQWIKKACGSVPRQNFQATLHSPIDRPGGGGTLSSITAGDSPLHALCCLLGGLIACLSHPFTTPTTHGCTCTLQLLVFRRHSFIGFHLWCFFLFFGPAFEGHQSPRRCNLAWEKADTTGRKQLNPR